jgi:hypothetical protein
MAFDSFIGFYPDQAQIAAVCHGLNRVIIAFKRDIFPFE